MSLTRQEATKKQKLQRLRVHRDAEEARRRGERVRHRAIDTNGVVHLFVYTKGMSKNVSDS